MRFALLTIALLGLAPVAEANDVHNAAFTSFGTYQPPPSADPTSNVLQAGNDAYANWSNAGIPGGIPSGSWTQCGSTLNPSGGEDTTAINNALSACTANHYVQLGAGTFKVDVTANHNIVFTNASTALRGTGNCSGTSSPYCQTVITPNPGGIVGYGPTVTQTCSGGTANCQKPTVILGPTALGFGLGKWSGCQWNDNSTGNTLSCAGAQAISADVAFGDTVIPMSNTSQFSVGMFVMIDERSGGAFITDPSGINNGLIWASSDAFTSSATPVAGRVAWSEWNGGGNGNTWDMVSPTFPTSPLNGTNFIGQQFYLFDRPNSEIHKITSITTNTSITIDSAAPLLSSFHTANNALVYSPNPALLQSVGIENLSILNSPDGAIDMFWCAYCWISNVEATHWFNGGFNTKYAAQGQITRSLSFGCANPDNNSNGGEYSIDLTNATTGMLVDNNITLQCGKGMTARGGGAGSVVAHNWMDRTYYGSWSIGPQWLDYAVNGSHNYSHHMLFEGNLGSNCSNDSTHVPPRYHTYFRNWCRGQRFGSWTEVADGTTVNDASNVPGSNGPFAAATINAYIYWMAYVGNVMGIPTTSAGWAYSGSTCCYAAAIWHYGNKDMGSNAGNPPSDTLVAGMTFQHGNYDYKTNTIADWSTGFSHTLPNSFYISSAPSYFAPGAACNYTWPWISSTGGTQIVAPTGCSLTDVSDGLPAKARWDNGQPLGPQP